MSTVSDKNKRIAQIIRTVVGGTPRVTRFWDEPRVLHIDIFSAEDRPTPGVNTYCTIGLSDHTMNKDGEPFPVRVEILCAGDKRIADVNQLLISTAFYIQRTGWLCCPGAILRNAVGQFDLSPTLEHLYFLPPFLWESLKSVELEATRVAWLLAVPISESERVYAEQYGEGALEDLFERAQIDVYDLSRRSAI